MTTTYDLTPNTTTVSEGVGNVTFTVTRSGSTPSETLYVSTLFDTASAAAGDYAGFVDQAISFGLGQTSATFSVHINDDSAVESTEHFQVMVAHAQGQGSAQAIDISDINITDNDTLATSYNLTPNTTTVSEGVGNVTFTVTRSGGTPSETLYVSTLSDTASAAAGDYTGFIDQAISFGSGQTSATFTVHINDDSAVESTEHFQVMVAHAQGQGSAQAIAISDVNITDNDTLATSYNLTPNTTTVSEGVGNVTFTVTRSGGTPSETLYVSTLSDTASAAAGDYTGFIDQAISFGSGQTSGTFTVHINDDSAVESTEHFQVMVAHAQGQGSAQAIDISDINITDNDVAQSVPNISIGNASVTEGGVLHFGVTLSAAAAQNITLGYDTFFGTASMANNDYVGGPGTVTILAGQTTGTINIQTVQDSTVEPDETMSVHLMSASFGNISQGIGTGTIVNDDVAQSVPNISIGNASVTEGGVLHFGVTLDTAAAQNITLGYDTFFGTASMANNDYVGGPGTVTILAGQTTGTINIQTVQDSTVEPDETMSVHLMSASFGNISQGIGTGTIVNDDVAQSVPNISIGNASVTEGGVLHFGVTLSAAAAQNITLGYDTFFGTASMANNDYLGGSGTLTILAGQTTGTINIQTVQDSTVEPDETMSVHLMSASFGNISQGIGTGTIVNDDVAASVPNISIGNASVTEGGVLHFGVTLSAAAAQNITLGYDTFFGTASMANNDYVGGPGTVTILAGQTTGTINIQTVQDSTVEPDETMSVHLMSASFGNISQGIGTGTIVNDDVAASVPNISIGNASVTEGGVLHFGVTLSAAAAQNITLGYDTFFGTASMANNDYVGGPGTVTILAGQTTGTINIQTVQDSTVEPDETMSVHLMSASFGNISQGIGTGTIVNDDVAQSVPNISIGNASVTEGGVLHFGVTLDTAAAQNITLGYDTFFGTASMANNDYVGGPGTVTILAGQTTGTINIQTVQDSNVEPDETMSVHLMTASFGTIAQGIGTGTIVNDDGNQIFPALLSSYPILGLNEIIQGNRSDPIDPGNDHGTKTRNLPEQWAYDFLTGSGAAIHSVNDGIVEYVKDDLTGSFLGYGNVITIRSTDGSYYTTYAHLSAGSTTLVAGQQVKAGDIIAQSGSSGTAGHAHLHIQFGTQKNIQTNLVTGDNSTQGTVADGEFDSIAPAYFPTLVMDFNDGYNDLDKFYNGTAGVDIFTANGNGDTVDTGPGADILTAGSGADTFVFTKNFGQDTIIGFNPNNDKIEFDNALFADFPAVTAHAADDGHGNVLITYDQNDTITLNQMAKANLHASNFLFAPSLGSFSITLASIS